MINHKFDLQKKLLFKHCNPVVRSILFTLILLCSLFYMDSGALNRDIKSTRPILESFNTFDVQSSPPGGGGEKTDCDIFDGKWVWDETYPLYDSKDCFFVDEWFRYSQNGRPDHSYTKWRWQPNNCNLPRFDAAEMLEKLRHKRVVFVGDSLGKIQWESLLCMLSSVVPDKSSISMRKTGI